MQAETSENRYDSLFMGIYLSMPMQDFYDHAYELNQQKIFFKNPGSTDIRYTYETEFRSPVHFVFFPRGGHQTVQKISGHMYYENWSPFSKAFNAGRLQEEVKAFMEAKYGGSPFKKEEHPKRYWPYSYVKTDGNRKIHLYRSFDDSKLQVVFENLDLGKQQ